MNDAVKTTHKGQPELYYKMLSFTLSVTIQYPISSNLVKDIGAYY